MSISRISSSIMMNNSVFNLQGTLVNMNKLQEKLSTSKNINSASDDPIGMTKLLRLTLDGSIDSQFKKNIDEGLSELDTTDSTLSRLNDVVNRARELAVQGSNATNSQTQLDALKLEVSSLITQAKQLGNTSIAGRYIFSGYKTDTAPFSTIDQDISYDGTGSDLDFERNLQVGKNLYVPTNLNGDDVLGHVTVVGGVPDGQGVLYTLTKLKLDMENGDYDAIRSDIDLVKTDQTNILSFQTQVGSRANQLTALKDRLDERFIIQAKQIASIQDVDVAKTISDLTYEQNTYQASLGSLAKILQATSIMNFLG